ncbi:MAG: hypothetical protein JXB25_12765 [Deltaproteobacteria bacterium]|nr:hypothetical protein [Deltaproteobacteria bacterium]
MFFLRFKEALAYLREWGGLIRFVHHNKKLEPGWEVTEYIGRSEEENLIICCIALAAGGMSQDEIFSEIEGWKFKLPGWEFTEQRAKYILSILKNLEARPHEALDREIFRFGKHLQPHPEEHCPGVSKY